MKPVTLFAGVLALAAAVLARGPQPCYNRADPDGYALILSPIPSYFVKRRY